MDTPREDREDEDQLKKDVGTSDTGENVSEGRDETAGYEFYQKSTPASTEDDTMNDASLIDEPEKMTPNEPDKRHDETIV